LFDSQTAKTAQMSSKKLSSPFQFNITSGKSQAATVPQYPAASSGVAGSPDDALQHIKPPHAELFPFIH